MRVLVAGDRGYIGAVMVPFLRHSLPRRWAADISAVRMLREASARRPRPRRPLGRPRYILIALLVVLAGLGVTTARLFVWPQQGMSGRVDAIIMLDGQGDRLDTALKLARAHQAPMLVISRGTPYSSHGYSGCGAQIPGVKVICFNPDPATTRGEARYIGQFAKRYRWHSIAVVATAPQDTVARLRIGRCFSGNIYLVNAPLPPSQLPYAIAYEWGSTIKALILQRSC